MSASQTVLPRSAIYVPGTRLDLWDKALAGAADQVIVDLEDAVPPAYKDDVRARVAARLQDPAGSAPSPLWVRVNPGADGIADAKAVAGPGLAGICLAKAESGEEVRRVFEAASAAAGREIPVEPLIESAVAVMRVAQIAAAPGVIRLQLGETDLAADVGVADDAVDVGLAYARSRVVFASAAAGILPPMAPVDPGFRDLAAFAASTRRLAGLGFVGRVCIHPAQVEIANEVYAPDPAELERARALIAAAAARASEGAGAFRGPDGQLVDAADVRAASRLIAQADRMHGGGGR